MNIGRTVWEAAIENTTGTERFDGEERASCESCGAMTLLKDLEPVRRLLYEDIENPEPIPQQDVEMWCSGCRETYPNLEEESPAGSEI